MIVNGRAKALLLLHAFFICERVSLHRVDGHCSGRGEDGLRRLGLTTYEMYGALMGTRPNAAALAKIGGWDFPLAAP